MKNIEKQIKIKKLKNRNNKQKYLKLLKEEKRVFVILWQRNILYLSLLHCTLNYKYLFLPDIFQVANHIQIHIKVPQALSSLGISVNNKGRIQIQRLQDNAHLVKQLDLSVHNILLIMICMLIMLNYRIFSNLK